MADENARPKSTTLRGLMHTALNFTIVTYSPLLTYLKLIDTMLAIT